MAMEPQEAPARVRQLPTWMLSRAAHRGHRLVAERTGERGASRSTYSSLASLEEFGPQSQADLGRRLGLDRKNVSELAAGLEREGFIERAADPDDRRRKRLRITPAGRELLDELHLAITEAQEGLLAVLSPAERAELVRLLGLLLEGNVS